MLIDLPNFIFHVLGSLTEYAFLLVKMQKSTHRMFFSSSASYENSNVYLSKTWITETGQESLMTQKPKCSDHSEVCQQVHNSKQESSSFSFDNTFFIQPL